MKRNLFFILLLIASEVVAYSQSFSIDAATAFSNYGYIDVSKKSISTEYAGFMVTPDWQFKKHYGLRLGFGTGWAFTANTTGTWEMPLHSTCNVNIAIVPYYEFIVNQWFFDLGVTLGCRLRLPYMNQEASKYLQTVSVGVGLDFRFGYKFSERWSVFANVNAQRTVYDLLSKTYYPTEKITSGCVNASLGIRYNFD